MRSWVPHVHRQTVIRPKALPTAHLLKRRARWQFEVGGIFIYFLTGGYSSLQPRGSGQTRLSSVKSYTTAERRRCLHGHASQRSVHRVCPLGDMRNLSDLTSLIAGSFGEDLSHRAIIGAVFSRGCDRFLESLCRAQQQLILTKQHNNNE